MCQSSRRSPRGNRRASGAAMAFAAALTLAACSDETAAPAAAPPVLTVSTTMPVQAEVARGIAAAGTVQPWQEVTIGTEVGGYRLAEIRAEVGDHVRRGQVLARLDTSVLAADLREQDAAVAEARAALDEAQANAGRARSLKATGALSARDSDQLITGAATARARLEAAEARLGAVRLRLSFADVRAPDDGVISARLATPGQIVASGTELYRLIRRGRLEWRAEVQEHDFVAVRPGLASVLDGSGTRGRVRAVTPSIDATTRVGTAYVDLPPDTTLRAGMFVQGRIEAGVVPGLTVPQRALVQRDGFDYLFVLRPAGTVEQRRVTRGSALGGQVEIVGGLGAADRVVVDGAGFLRDGDAVRLAPPVADASPATPPARTAP